MEVVGLELSWPPPSFLAVSAPQFSSGIKYLLKAYDNDNDKDKDTHKDKYKGKDGELVLGE